MSIDRIHLAALTIAGRERFVALALALAATLLVFAVQAELASAHEIPEPGCIETVNPHGKTVPPAGSTTLPGPRGGQNDDGFYKLVAPEGTEPVKLYVVDLGTGPVFGPFYDGANIKYTQAPGAAPSIKKIGSDKGQAGAVEAHITGKGDMAVYAVDADDRGSEWITCFVPPPPK
jgi:hypothetical protein